MDGSVKWMEHKEFEETYATVHEIKPNTVEFYLYTNSNPLHGKKINRTSISIKDSPFRLNQGTYFVIHGWKGSYTDDMSIEITKALLSQSDCNVIVIDWVRGRDEYIPAVLAFPVAGYTVGRMIKFLSENQFTILTKVSISGLGLGAHVSGFAGRTVGYGKVQSIVGLDPAGPFFNNDFRDHRLTMYDAYYVETIQTNGDHYGLLQPLGKATFYVNGGKVQPGCGDNHLCSHMRSWMYYVEAIKLNNFGTYSCPDYQAFINNKCPSIFTRIRMGNIARNAYLAEGLYYVPVKEKSPHGYPPPH
ncbi:uncharacterized protein Dwil_GK28152 [Drosophila willistoni]|uniref:Lipase domain-containing protein n=2 Tax=Drosophila willistoni TaxID=7260 RepID=A0A0Q9WTA1_DROWI|nr:uncharacterized protein Dwil_GK28152 [Drosophila willistoni]